MLKLILSDYTEIKVKNSSTLFDVQVDPSQYQDVWSQLTNENMRNVKLVSEDGDLHDQRENLVVDSEHSVKEKGEVNCHFYLREKTREELLEEKNVILEEKIATLEAALEVHDEAIGDLGVAISNIVEEEV